LVEWLGATESTINKLVMEALRVKDDIAPHLVEHDTEIFKKEISFKPRELPSEARSFSELVVFNELNDWQDAEQLHIAVQYLSDRKIDLKKYEFYLTQETEHHLDDRVIIPCTWKNEIIGYVARALVGDITPKYYSNYEPNYVFNVDKQKPNSKFVIVCEGPFDAMVVDGVAILGNECSDVQAEIINSLKREVIVVPDFDVKTVKGKKVWSGVKLIDQAIEYGWDVSFPIWHDTCKDVAEAVEKYGKLFVLKSILEGQESNKLKIELRKKKIYA
jgi:DNA primase